MMRRTITCCCDQVLILMSFVLSIMNHNALCLYTYMVPYIVIVVNRDLNQNINIICKTHAWKNSLTDISKYQIYS